MNKLRHLSALAIILAMVNACTTQQLTGYSATSPELDLREFFDGDLEAYGMLQDRSGRMTRRFTATIEASWQGEIGTLEEEFIFDDGEIQYRTWTLDRQGNGHYTGTAGDVIGTAEGSVSGSVFRWQYVLDVPWNDSRISVKLDDWLYLIDENHLINKTRMSKFGFKVGELTLVIKKV